MAAYVVVVVAAAVVVVCVCAHTQWKFYGFLVNIIASFQPQVSSSFCSIFISVFL